MATIDYKEKYEQALERARQFSEKPYLEDSAGIVEYIFPELKESEDELAMKEMLEYCYKRMNNEFPSITIHQIKRWLAWLEKQSKDSPVLSNSSNTGKSSWSEEDEEISSAIIKRLKGSDAISVDLQRAICWIDNVKDRVQPQLRQEWSEEDERFLCKCLGALGNPNYCYEDGELECMRNWLKSLRPKSQWKPSDEQMLAIDTAINVLGKGTLNGKQLIELQEQLKKLKGEEK